MDTVYPSPRVRTSLMNQPANVHSVVLSNRRQVILAGSWTSELRPWLKITASFQLSIYTSEASLAMHVNLLDSLNYSCHAESIGPKTEVLTVHGISEPDCLSVERWHTCYLPMFLNLLRTQYFLPPLSAWCCQSTSQVVILACNDIFYYSCGNLSAGLASEPAAWRNTSAWC